MNNKEIKFSTLIKILRKSFFYIALITIVFGAFGGAYAGFLQNTTYTATAEFYIPNFQGSSDYVSDTLLTASESLAEICTNLVKKKEVVKVFAEDESVNAIEYFGVGEIDAIKMLTSTISSKTLGKGYLSVSVTADTSNFAFRVIQSIQNHFPNAVKEMVSAGEGSTYQTNLVPVEIVVIEDEVVTNNPSVIKNAILFGFVGFMLAYCVFIVKFLLDTLVHDVQDISENFDEPLLAVIPECYTAEERKQLHKFGSRKVRKMDISKTQRQYKEKLLTRRTPFAVVESFNTLRTNLCYATAAEKCPVFVITSDFSAAGKSFVSANTSISLASLGKKTLLVECDMRCPDFNRIFNTDVHDGLSEVLSGNIKDANDIIIKTGYENFDLVFSGHIPPNPSELIGSKMMSSLIAKWKEVYDCIILDMPPLVEVSDASIVASIVSGYIIVARPNHSDITAITDITSDIKAVNGNIVGYVINGVDLKMGGSDMKYERYSKYSKYHRYSKYAKYSKYTVYAEKYQNSMEGSDEESDKA
jgi:capsular exopolysaccharide synthesis family protein